MNTNSRPLDTDLDLRTLRYFVAVGEELSFTRAAERLFVAQQAVSRDIWRLERRLGVALFIRTTRRVALTPEGQRLLVRARELIAIHDDILNDLSAVGRPVIVDLLSDGRLTGRRSLEALRAAAPEFEFIGRYGGATAAALGLLPLSEVDVVLGRVDWMGQRPMTGIERRLVRWEPLALLLPADHPLGRFDSVPVSQLSGLEIDVNPARPDAFEWIDLASQFLELAGARPMPPHVSAVGLDNQAHHLIRQGVPILTAIDHLEVPGGIVRQLIDPVVMYPWSIVWRRGLRRDVVAAIGAAVQRLATDTDWLELPAEVWLPEPEASRRTAGPAPVTRHPGPPDRSR